MSVASSAATHRGSVRPGNEDAMLSNDPLGLWIVADGAGGHGAGEVASRAVVEALADLPPTLSAAEVLAQLRLRLAAVHGSLQARSEAEGRARPMATTVVALMLRGEHYAVLWAGDSRAYLLRGGTLLRVTRDHSLVQEMVDAGVVTEAEAENHAQANVITRAIGADGPLELEKAMGRVFPGDLFLLCSDGLFKAMDESQIAARLLGGISAPALVEAAVAMGARDNVTAILVHASG
jgi:protein phosphatase/serine/threonine-protein phosphatase Stp1